jgi:peptide/nickel transport system ATP-binding protein
VAVMYAGQIVEQAGVEELFLQPQHPYTAALLESIPNAEVGGDELTAIPGVVPPAHSWPAGCRFHPRCAHAVERCRTEAPVAVLAGDSRTARCLRVGELSLEGVR